MIQLDHDGGGEGSLAEQGDGFGICPSPGPEAGLTWSDAAEPALVDGLVAGDQRALAEAYDRYSARVYGLAMRVVDDPSQAEEVTQDVFVSAWRHRAQFDGRRRSLCAWLLAATHSRAIDQIRDGEQGRHAGDGLSARILWESTEDAVLPVLDRQAIAVAVETLPAQQKYAIEQAYFAGQSARQIASATGVAVGTVKDRMRLGLLGLARELEQRLADAATTGTLRFPSA